MRRTALIATAAVCFAGVLASPAMASWVSANCRNHNHLVSRLKRSDARAYARLADNEGYEWGGGCWDNDDRDDTPGAPDSSGEGPDCSGFTFKAWHLRSTEGRGGFIWWDRIQNIHGPYSSYDFYSPAGSDPFYRVKKSRYDTLYMDAFAKNGHIGMIYTEANPSSYTDYIIEAYGDSSGTDVNVRGYRYESEYGAVRREGWTADCYPDCGAKAAAVVVVR